MFIFMSQFSIWIKCPSIKARKRNLGAWIEKSCTDPKIEHIFFLERTAMICALEISTFLM